MTREKMLDELNERHRKARSAWKRGVVIYAIDLLNDLEEGKKLTKENLLNGARNWKEYSYGGCSLIYNEDICERLCPPWEIRSTRHGELRPNKDEDWLDVQARALHQAASMLIFMEKYGEK